MTDPISVAVIVRAQAAQVGVQDVGRAYTLFLDVQRSVQFMEENSEQYLYHEALAPEGDAAAAPMEATSA